MKLRTGTFARLRRYADADEWLKWQGLGYVSLLKRYRDVANNFPPLTFPEGSWYLSFMNYAATGEGVTSCLAVAGSAEAAERLLKERLPEYFHGGIVTTLIDASANAEAQAMFQWIPAAASKILRQIPAGAGHFFTEIHYNLA
jgi:hypothetical protein